MFTSQHVAVIDVGKTSAKLALVDALTLSEIAVEKRPNTVLDGPPWPHFDLDVLWRFFREAVAEFQARYGVDAISVTTHGASAVVLDRHGRLAAPMLDYEHTGPDELAAEYDRIRPDFAETGSPRLGMGLNLGAQLFWQFRTDPGLFDRTAFVLTYPQYWGYLLTGQMASDFSSLGCHTDLWNPEAGAPSALVKRLGISDKLVMPRRPFELLGTLSPEIAAETGLAETTPVSVGIHDSNASLLPYLLGHESPFAVVSTGTWVICMAVGGRTVSLDPARDTLINVNAFGKAVPSARFMGGREFEIVSEGARIAPTPEDRDAVLAEPILLLPAVVTSSGPFQGRASGFTTPPRSPGQRQVALSFYLALMTDACLELAGAEGPAIVEGPFAENEDYCAMLAAVRPGGVRIARSVTGTSIGAAMLVMKERHEPDTAPVIATDVDRLRTYAEAWRARVAAGG